VKNKFPILAREIFKIWQP